MYKLQVESTNPVVVISKEIFVWEIAYADTMKMVFFLYISRNTSLTVTKPHTCALKTDLALPIHDTRRGDRSKRSVQISDVKEKKQHVEN